MAKKKVGELIKEARIDAELTQEQLAKKISDCSASDLAKAERGEKELTQAQLKQIAKITGVTQKSLLEAPFGAVSSASKTESAASAKKTEKKPTAAKKETAEKKPAASAKKPTSSTTAKKR